MRSKPLNLYRKLVAGLVLAVVASALAIAPAGAQANDVPTTPTELNVIDATAGSITLKWRSSTDDTNVVGYHVYRDGVEIGRNVTNVTGRAAAVGDIALCNTPHQINGHTAVAELLATLPGDLLQLGDAVQGTGTARSFDECYDASFGQFLDRVRPVPGNHEYKTTDADPFWDYFAGRTGERYEGWMSFDVGAWNVIGINTNCQEAGGCGVTSEQYKWLEAELQSSTAPCTLVYGHHPRWTSRAAEGRIKMGPIHRLLYKHGVEAYLNGDDHFYERWPKLDQDAVEQPFGVRNITVGTGGFSHMALGPHTSDPNPVTRNNDTYGVLALQLDPLGYDFNFMPAERTGTFTDQVADSCHGPNSAYVTFIDNNVATNSTYEYTVVAYDADGNESPARVLEVTNDANGLVVGAVDITTPGVIVEPVQPVTPPQPVTPAIATTTTTAAPTTTTTQPAPSTTTTTAPAPTTTVAPTTTTQPAPAPTTTAAPTTTTTAAAAVTPTTASPTTTAAPQPTTPVAVTPTSAPVTTTAPATPVSAVATPTSAPAVTPTVDDPNAPVWWDVTAETADTGVVTRNGYGNGSYLYGVRNTNLGIGEQPGDGRDMRLVIPFELSNEQRAAIEDGASVHLSIKYSARKNPIGNVDLFGLVNPASSAVTKASFQASAVKLVDNAITPASRLGVRRYDITAFARSTADQGPLVLRLQLDADVSGDGYRSFYTIGMGNSPVQEAIPTLHIVR